MKKLYVFFSLLSCLLFAEYTQAIDASGQDTQYEQNYDSSGGQQWGGQQYGGGWGGQQNSCGQQACAPVQQACPPDSRMNDCYCLYCHYKPCYYCTQQCHYIPQYSYQRCCRYIPQYYYTCHCTYCPQYTTQQHCRYVPQYYYKHECQPACNPCCQ